MLLKYNLQYSLPHQPGNLNASTLALGVLPRIISASTSPVPGACVIPQAPCPAATYTPPSASPLVLMPPSFSSGIRDTMGRPLDVTGRKHCAQLRYAWPDQNRKTTYQSLSQHLDFPPRYTHHHRPRTCLQPRNRLRTRSKPRHRLRQRNRRTIQSRKIHLPTRPRKQLGRETHRVRRKDRMTHLPLPIPWPEKRIPDKQRVSAERRDRDLRRRRRKQRAEDARRPRACCDDDVGTRYYEACQPPSQPIPRG